MLEDDKNGLSHLIEKEINSNDKILKPDFSQKTLDFAGRFVYNRGVFPDKRSFFRKRPETHST